MKRFARIGVLMTGIATATALMAQTVPDEPTQDATADTGLDLPANLQIFGHQDPNIRKPTAIVNGSVITGTDVDQRLAMVVALNKLKLDPKDEDQLKLQILRSLIDETLEIQAAKQDDISVSTDEIAQAYTRVAQRFNKTPQELSQYLKEIGSSAYSLQHQIQGEIAWNHVLDRKVSPFVNVGDAEVKAILDRLKAAKGTEEYHLKEIYLPATASNEQQVIESMKQMLEKMKQGVPFQYFAKNYSQATTASQGGDLGWVRPAMLPNSLADAAASMSVGQVAGPVQVPGGFSLIFLQDKRQVLTADPRDAVLSLRQVTISIPKDSTKEQAQSIAQNFAAETQKIQGCGGVDKIAQQLHAEVVDNDSVQVRSLPPQLQDIMLKMKVGEVTPPFGSLEQGIRVLVLCGRDDPKAASLPSAESIRNAEEQQRVNLRAERMLRDLRRDAVIEYR
ncbi:peptidylprolyl isomerase [Stakelama sediminis]|uniref:Parvulin-like PPIase n=1 Tax=Stakelama sediminis TaxID=463200 RepID=A0A840YZE6_9SPHN|nr:peptidylprolyl isomerase [Stakelama sediminis]MBB5718872.1 peptidyl-prolyl cis-trans isomerase SurA [Stakelama sediminis]